MEDFNDPPTSASLAGANLSSMSSNEREKLLQMLEQESTVRLSSMKIQDEVEWFFFRLKSSMTRR